MKKLLLVLFVSISFNAAVSAQARSFKDLIGKWEISGEEEGASLEIIDSSNIYLTYGGERKKVMSYTFDLSKAPGWFDFSIQDSAGVFHVKSLFQVFGDNAMKWQIFLDDDRTSYFSSTKGELMYLKKRPIAVTAVAKQ